MWNESDAILDMRDSIRSGAFEMSNKTIYRWVEPETVWYDDERIKHVIPEHQEEGEYVEEADMWGYVIVLLNGKKHVVKESDVVGIM